MQRMSPEDLGRKVQQKRGSMGIRACAAEIGVSPATLSRVERGHLPDSRTLGKICVWLGVDPGLIIGGPVGAAVPRESMPAVQIGFKQGRAFSAQTAKSLANLIIAAHKQFLSKAAPEGH